jgi:hypothetical protein
MSDVSTVVRTKALQAILRSATASRGDACSRRRRLTNDPPSALPNDPPSALPNDPPSALRPARAALLVEGVPTP